MFRLFAVSGSQGTRRGSSELVRSRPPARRRDILPESLINGVSTCSVSSRYPVLKVPAAGLPSSFALGHPRGEEIYCQSPRRCAVRISTSHFLHKWYIRSFMQRRALQAISHLIWMTTIRLSYICAAVICMEHTPCSGRATPRPRLPAPIRLDARQLRTNPREEGARTCPFRRAPNRPGDRERI